MINHFDRLITLLSDTDLFFGLFKLQMYMYLQMYLLYFAFLVITSNTNMSDMSTTVLYYGMSLTVLSVVRIKKFNMFFQKEFY